VRNEQPAVSVVVGVVAIGLDDSAGTTEGGAAAGRAAALSRVATLAMSLLLIYAVEASRVGTAETTMIPIYNS
jgi:hypothetical protein